MIGFLDQQDCLEDENITFIKQASDDEKNLVVKATILSGITENSSREN